MLWMYDGPETMPSSPLGDACPPPPEEQDIELFAEDTLVLKAHYQMPLATSEEVKATIVVTRRAFNRSVRKLVGWGFLDEVKIDWSGKNQLARRFVPKKGLEKLGVKGPTWHDAGSLAYLLDRLLPLKSFYRMIGKVKWVDGSQGFQGFQWFKEGVLDASLKFERGWIGLVWSGPGESLRDLEVRLQGLGRWLQKLATTDETPWPAHILFVVPEPFQKELVSQVIKRLDWPPYFAPMWCLSEGDFDIHTIALRSQGEVHQQPSRGLLGCQTWDRKVRESIFTLNEFQMKILELIVEWRGWTVPWLKEILHEPPNGRRIYLALQVLKKRRFVRCERQNGKLVYIATSKTLRAFAARDGVPARIRKGARKKNLRGSRRLFRHEHGLKSQVKHLLAQGILAAHGDRSWENMGKEGGGISPDAIVKLRESPHGPGWCNFEFELSARGPTKVRGKLRGFDSKLRWNNFPLMVVCYNAKAEDNFHKMAAPRGIKLMTTTLARLAEHGPLENGECWSMFGILVKIA